MAFAEAVYRDEGARQPFVLPATRTRPIDACAIREKDDGAEARSASEGDIGIQLRIEAGFSETGEGEGPSSRPSLLRDETSDVLGIRKAPGASLVRDGAKDAIVRAAARDQRMGGHETVPSKVNPSQIASFMSVIAPSSSSPK